VAMPRILRQVCKPLDMGMDFSAGKSPIGIREATASRKFFPPLYW